VPTDFKGKYRIEVEANIGPFVYNADKEWHAIE